MQENNTTNQKKPKEPIQDAEFIDARAEIHGLEDNQVLNVFFNMLDTCKTHYQLRYKNLLIISMEECFDRGLLTEDGVDVEEIKKKIITMLDEVVV